MTHHLSLLVAFAAVLTVAHAISVPDSWTKPWRPFTTHFDTHKNVTEHKTISSHEKSKFDNSEENKFTSSESNWHEKKDHTKPGRFVHEKHVENTERAAGSSRSHQGSNERGSLFDQFTSTFDRNGERKKTVNTGHKSEFETSSSRKNASEYEREIRSEIHKQTEVVQKEIRCLKQLAFNVVFSVPFTTHRELHAKLRYLRDFLEHVYDPKRMRLVIIFYGEEAYDELTISALRKPLSVPHILERLEAVRRHFSEQRRLFGVLKPSRALAVVSELFRGRKLAQPTVLISLFGRDSRCSPQELRHVSQNLRGPLRTFYSFVVNVHESKEHRSRPDYLLGKLFHVLTSEAKNVLEAFVPSTSSCKKQCPFKRRDLGNSIVSLGKRICFHVKPKWDFVRP